MPCPLWGEIERGFETTFTFPPTLLIHLPFLSSYLPSPLQHTSNDNVFHAHFFPFRRQEQGRPRHRRQPRVKRTTHCNSYFFSLRCFFSPPSYMRPLAVGLALPRLPRIFIVECCAIDDTTAGEHTLRQPFFLLLTAVYHPRFAVIIHSHAAIEPQRPDHLPPPQFLLSHQTHVESA